MAQVLVVGAGLAGLSTAMFLAQRGIDVLVIERQQGTAAHHKAADQNPRTMELLRIAGVDEAVRAAGAPAGPLAQDVAALSPMQMVAQVHVEPILLERAEKFGAQVRFETELVSFTQDEDGVSAELLHRPSGRTEVVRADYLVGADSSVGQRLGFRDGRVFLAGVNLDGNTAIGDGYDLAWKLAAVVNDEAGPGLLDSYEAERQQVAQLPESVGHLEVLFGMRCRSRAVLITDDDPAVVENPFDPSGRPGFRAPHVPLRSGDVELSTVDLFGYGWVLLTGEEGGVWHEAARHVAIRLGVPIETYGLGPELTDLTGQLTLRYGIQDGGASLIRPDGVVAWRAGYEVSDPASTLHAALSSLLDRSAETSHLGRAGSRG